MPNEPLPFPKRGRYCSFVQAPATIVGGTTSSAGNVISGKTVTSGVSLQAGRGPAFKFKGTLSGTNKDETAARHSRWCFTRSKVSLLAAPPAPPPRLHALVLQCIRQTTVAGVLPSRTPAGGGISKYRGPNFRHRFSQENFKIPNSRAVFGSRIELDGGRWVELRPQGAQSHSPETAWMVTLLLTNGAGAVEGRRNIIQEIISARNPTEWKGRLAIPAPGGFASAGCKHTRTVSVGQRGAGAGNRFSGKSTAFSIDGTGIRGGPCVKTPFQANLSVLILRHGRPFQCGRPDGTWTRSPPGKINTNREQMQSASPTIISGNSSHCAELCTKQ